MASWTPAFQAGKGAAGVWSSHTRVLSLSRGLPARVPCLGGVLRSLWERGDGGLETACFLSVEGFSGPVRAAFQFPGASSPGFLVCAALFSFQGGFFTCIFQAFYAFPISCMRRGALFVLFLVKLLRRKQSTQCFFLRWGGSCVTLRAGACVPQPHTRTGLSSRHCPFRWFWPRPVRGGQAFPCCLAGLVSAHTDGDTYVLCVPRLWEMSPSRGSDGGGAGTASPRERTPVRIFTASLEETPPDQASLLEGASLKALCQEPEWVAAGFQH